MKYWLSMSVCLGLVLAVASHAEDDAQFLTAGMVYDFFASDYCEPIPREVDAEELAEMRQFIEEDEYPMVLADLTGFLAGPHFGISPFGYASSGRGFATVATLWGIHEEIGGVALCFAMIQMGHLAVEPGNSRLVGLQQIDGAEPGDMLATGFVITLSPTERVSQSGEPVYRRERIGEVVITNGSFDLIQADEEQFEGRFMLQGWVALQDQDGRHPLTVQARAAGENEIERVPTLTDESEPEPESRVIDPDRDYSLMPVPATTREQRQRPRLDYDSPRREAFYNLLQIDLPRQAEAVIEGDVDAWNWQMDRQFSDQVDQQLPKGLSPEQVVHILVEKRDEVGEEFAIVWNPDRMEVSVAFEYFDVRGRYMLRVMDFAFTEDGALYGRGSLTMSSGTSPEHYRYADNYGALFGQEESSAAPEPAPVYWKVLERDAPLREAFYNLLDIDLPLKVEAGEESDAAGWEASQKNAFEARVAEHFPADMPPQAVAERLMALRESVGEAFALVWDPDRRSLIARYEYPSSEGYLARTMDFVFNEAGEQVFFSLGGQWSRSVPRSFPEADDLAGLFEG